MVKINRKQLLRYIVFMLILCIAYSLTKLPIPSVYPLPIILGSIQTLLYVGLIAFWGSSVQRRIIQPQLCTMLLSIGGFMMFWHLTKGIKYHIVAWLVGTGWIMRYLWYLYYLPLLLIPAILVMISLTLRKSESYRLPKKTVIALLSVSLALFFCVITNDLHQLVFNFPADAVVFSDKEYTHGILYYFCFAWIVGAALTFFVMALKSCRLPNKKILWLPIIPIVGCIIYSILYVFANGVWFTMDFTTMFTFSLVILFEITVSVGLIPSNNHYESLFRASEISAVITDENLSPIYTSYKVVLHEKSTRQRTLETGSVIENGIRISAYPIRGGYIFWQEDVSELSQILAKLEELNAELEEQYLVLQEAYDTQHKKQSLEEKNRLYYLMQKQTEGKVNKLYSLAEELKTKTDQDSIKELVSEMAVISAYLKRRNNLLFISEESKLLHVSELAYCLKESLANLSLNGAECDMCFELSGLLEFKCITKLYGAFEELAEAVLPSVSSLYVIVSETNDEVVLKVSTKTFSDLNSLAEKGFTVNFEGDNEWNVKYTALKGGESA